MCGTSRAQQRDVRRLRLLRAVEGLHGRVLVKSSCHILMLRRSSLYASCASLVIYFFACDVHSYVHALGRAIPFHCPLFVAGLKHMNGSQPSPAFTTPEISAPDMQSPQTLHHTPNARRACSAASSSISSYGACLSAPSPSAAASAALHFSVTEWGDAGSAMGS